MSTCCTTSSCTDKSKPGRHKCPANGEEYLAVPRGTILQHLDKPWKQTLKDQEYFFCSDSDCDVVYFTKDNDVINKSQLRTCIGVKEPDNDEALICYCFGVSNHEAKTQPETKAFVIQQTKDSLCSCTTTNPSGRCCLKDFPK